MEQRLYAYARVSAADQNLDRQIDALTVRDANGKFKFISSEREVFTDSQSGKNSDRPGLKSLLYQARSGDEITICSLDRLSRNYADIAAIFRELADRNIKIRVLDMPLISTTDRQDDDLTGRLIADITLSLLSYLAEMERQKIRQRQAEGMAARAARGLPTGRPRVQKPKNWTQVVQQFKEGRLSGRKAATLLGMTSTSFFRYLKSGDFDK